MADVTLRLRMSDEALAKVLSGRAAHVVTATTRTTLAAGLAVELSIDTPSGERAVGRGVIVWARPAEGTLLPSAGVRVLSAAAFDPRDRRTPMVVPTPADLEAATPESMRRTRKEAVQGTPEPRRR